MLYTLVINATEHIEKVTHISLISCPQGGGIDLTYTARSLDCQANLERRRCKPLSPSLSLTLSSSLSPPKSVKLERCEKGD